VINLDGITIKEFRGVRELSIAPNRKSFVVSGPNGSGKSGVVDAIEFALTGDVSRLSGKGTAGLSVATHGPHVTKRDDPAAAAVTLDIFVPSENKTVKLTRSVKKPKVAVIEPKDEKLRAVLERVAAHPEITLSRRDIIRYVIIEPTERSRQVQTLLKLDGIGQLRATLKTASNRAATAHNTAKTAAAAARESLKRHVDLEKLDSDEVLLVVNRNRAILGLAALSEMKADTHVLQGAATDATFATFNKESSLRDIAALTEQTATISDRVREPLDRVREILSQLSAEPDLLDRIRRRAFVEEGLTFVDAATCPLCDSAWPDIDALRAHLQEKLAKAAAAEAIEAELLDNAARIAVEARQLALSVNAVVPLLRGEAWVAFADEVSTWNSHLDGLGRGLDSVDEIVARSDVLAGDWLAPPPDLTARLDALAAEVAALPDQTASANAQTFLALLQDRLDASRRARRAALAAELTASRAALAYKTFCEVSEHGLRSLYDTVEEDFAAFYRAINSDDEAGFKAKLEVSDGKLDLSVDFHGQGMFPPGAYHSEGHQDGMGVCLYLALMKQVLGDDFRLAVLDDVVMSVDRDHRRQFCRLLKTQFPNTQFIITTHDLVWARQMRTEGVVDAKGGVNFHGWSVATGPVCEELSEIWVDIETDLAKNDVPAAASRLRRHMEYVTSELADELGARVRYKGDGNYDLGDMLSPVIRRQGDLLGLAAKAAGSWGNESEVELVRDLKEKRSAILTRHGDENWILNKAVHFNDWAQFSRADFEPIVAVLKDLLLLFRCSTCDSWLRVLPKLGDPESLKCDCGAISLNLKPKKTS